MGINLQNYAIGDYLPLGGGTLTGLLTTASAGINFGADVNLSRENANILTLASGDVLATDAIWARPVDGQTMLLVARNTAGQTQTVLTVVGAATVANSYITAQAGGTWTAVGTWTLPGFTMGNSINASTNDITNINSLTGRTATGLNVKGQLQLSHATGINFYTTGVTPTWTDTIRLTIGSGTAVVVATWSDVTHTGIKLTGASAAFGGTVLATGAGKTVDEVITALQGLGLVTQS